MQFPFEALDGGAIVLRRPVRRCAVLGREPVRTRPFSNPLVSACRQAARDGARESVIWAALFLAALLLLVLSLAVTQSVPVPGHTPTSSDVLTLP